MGKSNEALKKCMSDRHEFDHNGILFELQAVSHCEYMGYLANAATLQSFGTMISELIRVSLIRVFDGTKEADTEKKYVCGDKREFVTDDAINSLTFEQSKKLFTETQKFYNARGKDEKN